ncbi:MAG: hypothetical protein KAG26_00570 [Methylococcales bacterium]|nr:hypothetical protein [Methylococcales bacterium]
MKKRLSLFLLPFFLGACSDQNQYEAAILAEMQQEKDLKDYKIDPQEMTTCVVDLTSKKMPGLFPFDPMRMEAFQNYTAMLTLAQAKDPKKVMLELRTRFGSPKGLQEARINYTENVGNCLASLIMKAETKTLEDADAKTP